MDDARTPGHVVCPSCNASLELMALVPWGNGKQTLPVSPWICASCAALGILELATGRVTIAPEALWQVVQDRNPVLWSLIVETRARIRGDADHA